MRGLTKIILGIVIIIILVSVSWIIWIYNSGIIANGFVPTIMDCDMDLTNKTLIVTKMEKPSYFNWNDIEVITGNATLPTGFIELGDKITNCSGVVRLVYKPHNMLIGSWNFEE